MSTLSTCRPGNLYNFKIKDHLHNCFLIFKLKYQLAYFYFRQGDSAVAPFTEANCKYINKIFVCCFYNITIATMSDNRETQIMLYFTDKVF